MERITQRDEILALLAPLFEQARREGKWFWCNYQDLWFSPDQLAAEHANGSFIWGPVNWKLRDPQERLAEAERRRDAANNEVDRIRTQLAR